MMMTPHTLIDEIAIDEAFDPAGSIVTVHGELDVVTTPVLRERLKALIADGVRRLVVDLRPVDFIDSVALAALLHAKRELGEGGAMAVVVDPESYTHLILEVAGLPDCLGAVPSRDAAIAAVCA
jgi:anti-sigma B factor antagonist